MHITSIRMFTSFENDLDEKICGRREKDCNDDDMPQIAALSSTPRYKGGIILTAVSLQGLVSLALNGRVTGSRNRFYEMKLLCDRPNIPYGVSLGTLRTFFSWSHDKLSLLWIV